MLNHLYARSLSEFNVRVLGLSIRYKQKFVTVVFYTTTTTNENSLQSHQMNQETLSSLTKDINNDDIHPIQSSTSSLLDFETSTSVAAVVDDAGADVDSNDLNELSG
jgi:hypothetical protein